MACYKPSWKFFITFISLWILPRISWCWLMLAKLVSMRVEWLSFISNCSVLLSRISVLTSANSLSACSLFFWSCRRSSSMFLNRVYMSCSFLVTLSCTSDLLLVSVNILKSCLKEYILIYSLFFLSSSSWS
jgi:hypothetical protein